MQLISSDVNENDCTTSKVISMESPKHQTLEKENFDTFLNISEEKLVDKAAIVNDDESMDVDEISESNEDIVSSQIMTGEGILNGRCEEVSLNSLEGEVNKISDNLDNKSIEEELKNETTPMNVATSTCAETINETKMEIDQVPQTDSNNDVCDLDISSVLQNVPEISTNKSNLETNHSEVTSDITLNDGESNKEPSKPNEVTESVNADPETTVDPNQSSDTSLDLTNEKLLLEEDDSEDVNTTHDKQITSETPEERAVEDALLENDDNSETREKFEGLENKSPNDNAGDKENYETTESIADKIKVEVVTEDSLVDNDISNNESVDVGIVKEENENNPELMVVSNGNNAEEVSEESESIQSVIVSKEQEDIQSVIKSEANEDMSTIQREDGEQQQEADISNAEITNELKLETVDIPFQAKDNTLEQSLIKDEPAENIVESILTENDDELNSPSSNKELDENVEPLQVCDEDNVKVKIVDSNTNTDDLVVLPPTEDNAEIKSESSVEPMVVSDDEDCTKTDDSNTVEITNNLESEGKENPESLEKSVDKKDDGKKVEDNLKEANQKEAVCFSVDDEDDDIVLIDDGAAKTDVIEKTPEVDTPPCPDKTDLGINNVVDSESSQNFEVKKEKTIVDVPIFPLSIMKELKPKLSTMSREDLEEYVVVKIVESISGRSALSDIQMKLKMQEKSIEEWKKKVMSLSKQNKDLSIVLRNLCDEQNKRSKDNPMPIKITRSVGLQVGYPSVKPANTENSSNLNTTKHLKPPNPIRPTPVQPPVNNTCVITRRARAKQTTPLPVMPIVQQPPTAHTTPPIPHVIVRSRKPNAPVVPKISPAPQVPSPIKTATPNIPRSVLKNLLEPTKSAEKRPALQSIDLTDDEPPAKISAIKTPTRPSPTIRPVSTNQLTNIGNKMTYVLNNSPMHGNRPVYIPINGHGQNLQQNSMVVKGKVLNKVPIPTLRQIPSPMRMGSPIPIRPVPQQHPAPLPHSINSKTQLNSNWKWIPPRPTLKIARVDNGIVISWEMEDFSDIQHECVASYQIFAYQEPNAPPSTELWKKIGDVKALPLPMACTLTHFMAGYKYFFAVRAIDIRSRVGPFSAPGQITLVNNKK